MKIIKEGWYQQDYPLFSHDLETGEMLLFPQPRMIYYCQAEHAGKLYDWSQAVNYQNFEDIPSALLEQVTAAKDKALARLAA